MAQGFCGFIRILGGSGDCGEGSGCMAAVSPGFRWVLFCPRIKIKIKIFNSIRHRRVLSFC